MENLQEVAQPAEVTVKMPHERVATRDKLEHEFPLFSRIYEIAFDGKDPETIVQL